MLAMSRRQGSISPTSVLFAVFQTENLANGGVASVTEIINGLSGYRHVVTQLNTQVNSAWKNAGAEVTLLNLPYAPGESFGQESPLNKMRWMLSIARSNFRIFRLLRGNKINVVHCNDPAPFWHVVPAAKLAGIPVIFNLRDTKSTKEKSLPGRYRRKFRLVPVVLVLSHEMSEFYMSLVGEEWIGRARTKIEYIHSIVNPPGKSDAIESKAIPPTAEARPKFSIGVVAAFNDKKNQLEFIQKACPELLENNPDFCIVFIGDFRPSESDYAESCRQAATKLQVGERIRFVGYQSDVWEWYRTLDAVLVVSRKEGMARSMIESIAVGTPVVSFDVCSAREILERHDCGIVVPQGDYKAMVGAVSRLAKNPELRERLAKHGVLTAERLFSKHLILEKYRNLYERLSRQLNG